jgi:hypothetical protein
VVHGRPEPVRIPLLGIDFPPAELLAFLEHYLRQPADRAELADDRALARWLA